MSEQITDECEIGSNECLSERHENIRKKSNGQRRTQLAVYQVIRLMMVVLVVVVVVVLVELGVRATSCLVVRFKSLLYTNNLNTSGGDAAAAAAAGAEEEVKRAQEISACSRACPFELLACSFVPSIEIKADGILDSW